MSENGGSRAAFSADGKEITLVGTAHVSRESINEVSAAIRAERPGVVCVELDAGRYKAMFQKAAWEKLDIVKVFREGKGFLLLANLVLSSFQRRMGDELGVKPGEEMRAAIETAQSLGIPFTFCDREVQLTLNRAWRKCGFLSKAKLLASLASSVFTTEKFDEATIENLKNESALDGMMAELAAYMPEIKETLIDERDRFLAAKIWDAAPALSAPESAPLAASGAEQAAQRVLAVVGAGHLHGIIMHLKRISAGEETTAVDALNSVPPPSRFAVLAGWTFPALIALLLAAGFFTAGAEVSLTMLSRWALWNGSLAALGALLALGHPLSILVSFVGAPIATLNPFIGVGLFSGVAEATMRRPRVSDAENLAGDVSSLKGLYRNRITRALLVFLFSSLGGAIGNFISIPALLARLFGG